jgi:D-glycero-alpha-D-manno-heptose 1-phosphate guanylyltransferase
MEAIILAGGRGTRLQSLIKDVPKPMADVGGRPFLAYIMDYLSEQNISKALLSVGYKHEIISDYFGPQYKNLAIEYVIEDAPLGTGGAIREAIKEANGRDIAVLNGDSFFNVDLGRMFSFHCAHDSILTLAVKPMHNFSRYGTVVVEGNRVAGFEEKSPKGFGYINGGVYIMKKGILEFFRHNSSVFSLEVDFLHR